AGKEAKEATSWTNPDEDYERATAAFVAQMLATPLFRADLRGLCAQIERTAVVNALAQTVLRLCSPGIADTYQGGELWNQSLTDPDNRRPVDYALRQRLLGELHNLDRHPEMAAQLLDRFADGAIKLYV